MAFTGTIAAPSAAAALPSASRRVIFTIGSSNSGGAYQSFGIVSSLIVQLIERVKGSEIKRFHDITERTRDQETLREQAALLDNAQRIGRMGSWNLDLRTGRLAWPDATCRLFGIEPSFFPKTSRATTRRVPASLRQRRSC